MGGPELKREPSFEPSWFTSAALRPPGLASSNGSRAGLSTGFRAAMSASERPWSSSFGASVATACGSSRPVTVMTGRIRPGTRSTRERNNPARARERREVGMLADFDSLTPRVPLVAADSLVPLHGHGAARPALASAAKRVGEVERHRPGGHPVARALDQGWVLDQLRGPPELEGIHDREADRGPVVHHPVAEAEIGAPLPRGVALEDRK